MEVVSSSERSRSRGRPRKSSGAVNEIAELVKAAERTLFVLRYGNFSVRNVPTEPSYILAGWSLAGHHTARAASVASMTSFLPCRWRTGGWAGHLHDTAVTVTRAATGVRHARTLVEAEALVS